MESVPARAESVVELVPALIVEQVEVAVQVVELVEVAVLELRLEEQLAQLALRARQTGYFSNQSPLVAN